MREGRWWWGGGGGMGRGEFQREGVKSAPSLPLLPPPASAVNESKERVGKGEGRD